MYFDKERVSATNCNQISISPHSENVLGTFKSNNTQYKRVMITIIILLFAWIKVYAYLTFFFFFSRTLVHIRLIYLFIYFIYSRHTNPTTRSNTRHRWCSMSCVSSCQKRNKWANGVLYLRRSTCGFGTV